MMETDIKHTAISYEPKDDAALTRLRNMHDAFEEAARHSDGYGSNCEWKHSGIKTSKIEIAPGVFAHVINYERAPKLTGVVLCADCTRRAAMYLRDLAGVCEDLAAEVEKHGTVQNP